MKILIAIDVYKGLINGIVTSTNTLIEGLRKRGHEVRILTLSENRKSYQEDNMYLIGSVGVGFIYPEMRIKTASFNKFFKEIVAWEPDVIHCQTEVSAFYMARKIAKRLNIPLIQAYHTLYEDYTHYFCPSKKLGKVIIKSFSRSVCNKADLVIAPTRKVHELLHCYGVEKPIRVIPTGVDLSSYANKPSKSWISKTKEELGIKKTDFVMVYVGRLGEEKNIAELISGMSFFKEKDIRLLVVGDGPARGSLEEKVLELDLKDKVIFAGMVPHEEVVKYYHLGDIFVSASTSETQGLTYLEAAAASLPLVCRYDQCLEGVIINGENGFVYDSVDTLVNKVNFLSNKQDLCKKMGKRSKEIVESKYSVDSFVESVYECYEIRKSE